ncbi:MAG: cell division protein ZapB [Nitrospirae bacterium]|nr:cell division protein ZapB [Nitrospirota bacterium]
MEKLEILEVKIRKMMDLIKQLKSEKADLETGLKALSERALKLEEENSYWRTEKQTIRTRVEKILGEIEALAE